MKHLNKLFAGALLLAGFAANAQDSTNPWAVSFGVNAVDTKVSASSPVKQQFSEFLMHKIIGTLFLPVSYVNVTRNVGNGFNFGVTGSFNKISRWVEKVPGTLNSVFMMLLILGFKLLRNRWSYFL